MAITNEEINNDFRATGRYNIPSESPRIDKGFRGDDIVKDASSIEAVNNENEIISIGSKVSMNERHHYIVS